ncbi:hypothetical protein WJ970_19945 [Achromobacter xylosoxidans]
MSIALADLEQAVMDLLRAQPAFAGWKKKGKRCLWRTCGEVQQGAELIRYRGSFDNAQHLSLGVYASFPCEREWPVYVPVEIWNKGRLYRRAYLKPGDGLIDEPTLGSGAVLTIHNEQELANWLAALPTDIENHLAPWLARYQSLEQAWYEYRIPSWRLAVPASSRMRIRRAEPAAYHHKRDSYPARSRPATRA